MASFGFWTLWGPHLIKDPKNIENNNGFTTCWLKHVERNAGFTMCSFQNVGKTRVLLCVHSKVLKPQWFLLCVRSTSLKNHYFGCVFDKKSTKHIVLLHVHSNVMQNRRFYKHRGRQM